MIGVENLGLYIYDQGEVKDIGCVQALDHDGDEVSVIDRVYVGDDHHTKAAGVRDAGTMTFEIALRLQTVHKRLLELSQTREDVLVCISFDNSTTPTYSDGAWSDGGKELYTFVGFVSSAPLSFDDTINSNLVIQRKSAARLDS